MNGWNIKIYYTSSVLFEIVTKIGRGRAPRGPLYIYTGIKNANAWTGFKCMCNTHNSNNNKADQENRTTLQSSNAKSTNIRGLWCPCSDNEDTATVITMQQMHATRIALLLAGKNAALLILGGALRILDEGEKEE